jgi:hypothetical protein
LIARHGYRGQAHRTGFAWQNGFAERLIGSIRRESVDHIIVLGEVHLRQILQSYTRYYTGHWTKMHRSLAKFSESEASNHMPSWADFTITMPELKFSVHTTAPFGCEASKIASASIATGFTVPRCG